MSANASEIARARRRAQNAYRNARGVDPDRPYATISPELCTSYASCTHAIIVSTASDKPTLPVISRCC